jgi:predicted GNAT family acetyltransferase
MEGKELTAAMINPRAGVSELLAKKGVPGVRYLDQMSRDAGEGTSNFVVFPKYQDLLTIKEINDKPVGGLLGQAKSAFDVSRKDASDIFGAGAERVMYKDPTSGGTLEVLAKPDGTASVLSLEVPETSRGKGIGQSLQAQVMQDFPEMMGQVSSKAAAKTAYRLGRRPAFNPEATLEDVYKMMDEDSSVNLVSPDMQKRFGQRTNLLD